MANNTFKSITSVITTVNEIIYTAPPGVTTIVINAQIANTSDDAVLASFSYYDSINAREVSLIERFRIAGNDSYSAITGRLVVNENDSIKATADTDAPLRLTLSILETENV